MHNFDHYYCLHTTTTSI